MPSRRCALSLLITGVILSLWACSLPAAEKPAVKSADKPAVLSREEAARKKRLALYPLPYPPQLPDGKTHVTEHSERFLKPGPNLKDGVSIAKTPPVVDFLYYPLQDYPGHPWSHRSDGIVVGDIYYSSSNDHLAPRGTAHLWAYDATTYKFRHLCDTSKFLESVRAFPPDMNYRPGEMQSRVDLGSDGWLYYATDRGSPTVTNDTNGYKGEWILRTHSQTAETEIVYTHPIEKHTIPASVLDPQRMILYCGTAVGRDAPNQKIQFFALDVRQRKIIKVADDGPTRVLIFSKSTGRVFWEGKMYDPETNEITPANVPHVRSATTETPQGIVYGTSGTKADLWAFHVRTGELKQLGSAAVASQEYIASIEVDPTGRYLYYVPGAHGGASRDGTPVVQWDLQTGQRKVLAFLHDVFWEKYGYALDGSFGNALDERGGRLFISWDGWRKGQPRGWESAAMTVLHIPESERIIEPAAEPKPELPTESAALTSEPQSPAQELRWDARNLFEQGLPQHLQLTTDGSALVLEEGLLIEDDGPAAGYSYQPNEEEPLSDKIHIRKLLLIPHAGARAATLLVSRTGAPPDGSRLTASINGQSTPLEFAGKVGNYWQAYRFNPHVLRQGSNDIVLSGAGRLRIALAQNFQNGSRTRTSHPNRSAKSTDGGQTWDDAKLGPQGTSDGEYYVRLWLDQHHPAGQLLLPVIDTGNLAGKSIAPSLQRLGSVRLTLRGTPGDAGTLRLQMRSGTTSTPDRPDAAAGSWSDWRDVPGNPAAGLDLPRLTGRYLQLRVELQTSDPRVSPRIEALSLRAAHVASPGWADELRVTDEHRESIVRTAIPFEYEPFDRPELQRLRQNFQLDRVVAGATTEFEQIQRLAAWASQQWQRGHLGEIYPPWNALEILKPHRDGTPVGGFCQQYNLVFLQACESFGLVGRAVSLGQGNSVDKFRSGHEVVEIWSNDYRKWVYVDGQMAWYVIDPQTQIPLSLREIRTRQLAGLQGQTAADIQVVRLAETAHPWDKVPFLELRLIPRSNFLQSTAPLPLNQGMQGWFWTGHIAWTDAEFPALPLYGNFVRRAGDFDWTLNQAQLDVQATDVPGELRVQVDTETPGLTTLLKQVDDGPEQPVGAEFRWKLHPGTNRLQVRPQNSAGRPGSASWITVQRP